MKPLLFEIPLCSSSDPYIELASCKSNWFIHSFHFFIVRKKHISCDVFLFFLLCSFACAPSDPFYLRLHSIVDCCQTKTKTFHTSPIILSLSFILIYRYSFRSPSRPFIIIYYFLNIQCHFSSICDSLFKRILSVVTIITQLVTTSLPTTVKHNNNKTRDLPSFRSEFFLFPFFF